MAAIFIYVLHIPISGSSVATFSSLELVLAAVVALSALFGLVASLRAEGDVLLLPALVTVVLFAGLQAGALWWTRFSNDTNFKAWIEGSS